MPYTTLHLQVSKANFLQNTSIFSPAPIFASIMAMHALDKELGKIGGELGVRGVGILHHDARLWAEHMENKNGYLQQAEPVHRRGATLFAPEQETPTRPMKNPIQPMILGDLEWTLLLSHEFPVDRDTIKSVLSGMRFAGGTIASFRDSDLIVRCFNSFEEAIQSLRSGFWVDDATYLLEGSQNPMKDLLVQQRRNAWMIPANLGYALLEAPTNRHGARDGLPHAFSEHLIGLVQYRSIHKVRDEISEDRLWKWKWEDDQFFVSNHHPFFV